MPTSWRIGGPPVGPGVIGAKTWALAEDAMSNAMVRIATILINVIVASLLARSVGCHLRGSSWEGWNWCFGRSWLAERRRRRHGHAVLRQLAARFPGECRRPWRRGGRSNRVCGRFRLLRDAAPQGPGSPGYRGRRSAEAGRGRGLIGAQAERGISAAALCDSILIMSHRSKREGSPR